MGNLSRHASNVLVDKVKTKAFFVDIVQHPIFGHVLEDVGSVPDALGKVLANGLQKTNVGTVVVSGKMISTNRESEKCTYFLRRALMSNRVSFCASCGMYGFSPLRTFGTT